MISLWLPFKAKKQLVSRADSSSFPMGGLGVSGCSFWGGRGGGFGGRNGPTQNGFSVSAFPGWREIPDDGLQQTQQPSKD